MRAAIYTRVSTADQSVDMQLRDLSKLAASRDFEVVKEYCDEGQSGAKSSRPALDKMLADANGQRLVPGFKVKTVDSTAAGDIFNGALSVALAEGKAVFDAVRFANAAAALSVTRLGAQPSAPSRADIEKFIRSGR